MCANYVGEANPWTAYRWDERKTFRSLVQQRSLVCVPALVCFKRASSQKEKQRNDRVRGFHLSGQQFHRASPEHLSFLTRRHDCWRFAKAAGVFLYGSVRGGDARDAYGGRKAFRYAICRKAGQTCQVLEHLTGLGLRFRLALAAIGYILIIYVSLAIQIKRWHDRNKSGWWVFINAIPYIGIVWSLLELGFPVGTSGPNRFGLDPRQSKEKRA